MPHDERREPNQSPDAQRLRDRLLVHEMAIEDAASRLAEAKKNLAHLTERDQATHKDATEASKVGGERTADIDWFLALNSLKLSPDLINEIWERRNAEKNRRERQLPTPPSEH